MYAYETHFGHSPGTLLSSASVVEVSNHGLRKVLIFGKGCLEVEQR